MMHIDTFAKLLEAGPQHLSSLAFNGGIDTAPEFAILVIFGIYLIAAILNCYIPKLAIEHALTHRDPLSLVSEFWLNFSPYRASR